MSDQKRVTIRYKPRDQFRPFHSRKQRWSVLVCHRLPSDGLSDGRPRAMVDRGTGAGRALAHPRSRYCFFVDACAGRAHPRGTHYAKHAGMPRGLPNDCPREVFAILEYRMVGHGLQLRAPNVGPRGHDTIFVDCVTVSATSHPFAS